jgi:uncharacterized membrane-anchored protein
MTNPGMLSRLPVLTRVTALALLGSALAFASETITLGLDLSVSVVTACVLAATALTATGWRWTPLLGAATIAVITANNPFLVDNLLHVNGLGLFVSTAVNVVCAAVAVAVGVAATVVNYRPVAERAGSAGRR